MAVKRLDTFTVHYLDCNVEVQFPNKELALDAARCYVDNNAYAKPFANDDVYLFGPGDGTTSVMVRQDVEFEEEETHK